MAALRQVGRQPGTALRQASHDRLIIADEADVGALRRTVSRHAALLGVAAGRAELVATELATNILRHATPGGWVLVRPVEPAGIEIIAVDRGPGIADPGTAIEGRLPEPGDPDPGRGPGHGLGCGLAAVRRAASYGDIHTEPGRGTTVLAVVGAEVATAARSWAGVSVGITPACGDGWAVVELDGETAVAVVDGLGHGPKASIAADTALAVFAEKPTDLPRFIDRANDAMRATRGGVVAACRLVPAEAQVHHLAVGNVSGRIRYGRDDRGLGSRLGVLGVRAVPPRVGVTSYPWPSGAVLVLWTDGLSSQIDLGAYPGLFDHDPAVIAATLHRDHTRERDDATVVVARNPVAGNPVGNPVGNSVAGNPVAGNPVAGNPVAGNLEQP